jgi:hypothetical protein
MYLIAEEVIRSDQLDCQNPFQWSDIESNLPGMMGYTPSRAWLMKRCKDHTLASDMVIFVNDKQLTASSSSRTRDAGHKSSTRESYLGIQDTLQKWHMARGIHTPGAWVGTVVHMDKERGVAVLT